MKEVNTETFYLPILTEVSTHEALSEDSVIAYVYSDLNISLEQDEVLNKTHYNLCKDAIANLNESQLISKVSNGKYHITSNGMSVLEKSKINSYLKDASSFNCLSVVANIFGETHEIYQKLANAQLARTELDRNELANSELEKSKDKLAVNETISKKKTSTHVATLDSSLCEVSHYHSEYYLLPILKYLAYHIDGVTFDLLVSYFISMLKSKDEFSSVSLSFSKIEFAKALTHLLYANLVNRLRGGIFVITEDGRKASKTRYKSLCFEYFYQYKSYLIYLESNNLINESIAYQITAFGLSASSYELYSSWKSTKNQVLNFNHPKNEQLLEVLGEIKSWSEDYKVKNNELTKLFQFSIISVLNCSKVSSYYELLLDSYLSLEKGEVGAPPREVDMVFISNLFSVSLEQLLAEELIGQTEFENYSITAKGLQQSLNYKEEEKIDNQIYSTINKDANEVELKIEKTKLVYSFSDFIKPILIVLNSSGDLPFEEIQENVYSEMNLDSENPESNLKYSEINEAFTKALIYLFAAGLIEFLGEDIYQLTDNGYNIVETDIDSLNENSLYKQESFINYLKNEGLYTPQIAEYISDDYFSWKKSTEEKSINDEIYQSRVDESVDICLLPILKAFSGSSLGYFELFHRVLVYIDENTKYHSFNKNVFLERCIGFRKAIEHIQYASLMEVSVNDIYSISNEGEKVANEYDSIKLEFLYQYDDYISYLKVEDLLTEEIQALSAAFKFDLSLMQKYFNWELTVDDIMSAYKKGDYNIPDKKILTEERISLVSNSISEDSVSLETVPEELVLKKPQVEKSNITYSLDSITVEFYLYPILLVLQDDRAYQFNELMLDVYHKVNKTAGISTYSQLTNRDCKDKFNEALYHLQKAQLIHGPNNIKEKLYDGTFNISIVGSDFIEQNPVVVNLEILLNHKKTEKGITPDDSCEIDTSLDISTQTSVIPTDISCFFLPVLEKLVQKKHIAYDYLLYGIFLKQIHINTFSLSSYLYKEDELKFKEALSILCRIKWIASNSVNNRWYLTRLGRKMMTRRSSSLIEKSLHDFLSSEQMPIVEEGDEKIEKENEYVEEVIEPKIISKPSGLTTEVEKYYDIVCCQSDNSIDYSSTTIQRIFLNNFVSDFLIISNRKKQKIIEGIIRKTGNQIVTDTVLKSLKYNGINIENDLFPNIITEVISTDNSLVTSWKQDFFISNNDFGLDKVLARFLFSNTSSDIDPFFLLEFSELVTKLGCKRGVIYSNIQFPSNIINDLDGNEKVELITGTDFIKVLSNNKIDIVKRDDIRFYSFDSLNY